VRRRLLIDGCWRWVRQPGSRFASSEISRRQGRAKSALSTIFATGQRLGGLFTNRAVPAAAVVLLSVGWPAAAETDCKYWLLGICTSHYTPAEQAQIDERRWLEAVLRDPARLQPSKVWVLAEFRCLKRFSR
jgi:hypothetical protein